MPNPSAPHATVRSVLLTSDVYRNGGSERQLLKLCRRFPNIHFTYITRVQAAIDEEENLRTIPLPNDCTFTNEIRIKRKAIRQIQPERIISFLDRSNASTALAALLTRYKKENVALGIRNDWQTQYNHRMWGLAPLGMTILSSLYRRHLVICNSSELSQRLPIKQIKVIPNIIEK